MDGELRRVGAVLVIELTLGERTRYREALCLGHVVVVKVLVESKRHNSVCVSVCASVASTATSSITSCVASTAASRVGAVPHGHAGARSVREWRQPY